MFRFGNTPSKALALLVALLLCVSSATVCLADAYSEYFNAYGRLTKNRKLDASIDATLCMDGQYSYFSGNMKVDDSKDIMYYDLIGPDERYIAFCDGKYLYMDRGGDKVKFSIIDPEQPKQNSPAEAAPAEEADQAETEGDAGTDAPGDFNVSEFMSDFSSMLEPGQIAQLGLLSPVPKTMVTKTSKDGEEYTLEIADAMVQFFLTTMKNSDREDDQEDEGGEGQTTGDSADVEYTALKNFVYRATISNNIVTGVTIMGDLTVHVPAQYMTDKTPRDYTLNMDVRITFNNPGNESDFSLPSTDGYETVDD